uniref:Uncharacterized protein n=1 Tax=Melanopsichium pennsylvanicum 4 TaxID=1398559 RepID=A0A077QUT9_9BASI|nr:uncharacterized protein BN887_06307 [Melanopsichium pennsylvanicum 4]
MRSDSVQFVSRVRSKWASQRIPIDTTSDVDGYRQFAKIYARKDQRRPYAMSVANRNPFAILGGLRVHSGNTKP